MTGDNAARLAEDIGGQELSYAEVKAIASGNPAVLTLAEADAEMQRLTLLRKNHLDEQYTARQKVKSLPASIDLMKKRLHNLEADASAVRAHLTDPVMIGNRKVPRDDLIAALDAKLNTRPMHVNQPTRVPLGTFRGLRFGLIEHPNFTPDVYLEGAGTCTAMLSKEHQGPRAILNAADRLTREFEEKTEKAGKDLAIAEGQLNDYGAKLGKPFTHESYLNELSTLREQLKLSLSKTNRQEGENEGPTSADIAGRIKALKAANTLDPATETDGWASSVNWLQLSDFCELGVDSDWAVKATREGAPAGREILSPLGRSIFQTKSTMADPLGVEQLIAARSSDESDRSLIQSIDTLFRSDKTRVSQALTVIDWLCKSRSSE